MTPIARQLENIASAYRQALKRQLAQRIEEGDEGEELLYQLANPIRFNGPASQQNLAAIEELMGERLPAELRELYRTFDGTEGSFFGRSIQSTSRIIKDLESWTDDDVAWQARNGVFTSTPEGAIAKVGYHRKRFPLLHDGGGNFIGVDLIPDAAGSRGQIINFGRDEDHMKVYAASLGEFFDFIADSRLFEEIAEGYDADYAFSRAIRELWV